MGAPEEEVINDGTGFELAMTALFLFIKRTTPGGGMEEDKRLCTKKHIFYYKGRSALDIPAS